jgi:hypothetical protein
MEPPSRLKGSLTPRRTNSKKASKRADIVAKLRFQSQNGSTGTVSPGFMAKPWGNYGEVWQELAADPGYRLVSSDSNSASSSMRACSV